MVLCVRADCQLNPEMAREIERTESSSMAALSPRTELICMSE